MFKTSILFLFFSISYCCFGQQSVAPKREFRGVWVATVNNIDWPSKPGLSTDAQKQELIAILDQSKRNGLNAVFFQIRPTADAFYQHSMEPWSQYLMGKQNLAPLEPYDPLAFAIQEAHARGIELHAWFNPYRATMDAKSGLETSENHITRKRPDLLYTYAGQKLFDPGIPEVKEYIIKVVLDVVKRYDIDGVHFDDYFYPYPAKGQVIGDEKTYARYNSKFTNIGDWRRSNVDALIKSVNDSVHFYKRYVKFGVSPFGIWQNKKKDVLGSNTNGLSNYEALFADSRKWVKEGWVDYINPQIYFSLTRLEAPFGVLVDWWNDNSFNRHLYIGQAAYLVNVLPKNKNAKAWHSAKQIPDQIKYIRNTPHAQGSVFFSAKSFSTVAKAIADSLRTNYYRHSALPPKMAWLDDVNPNPVRNVVAKSKNGKVELKWDKPLPAKDKETASGYVVYRFDAGETISITQAKPILNISYLDTPSFVDVTAQKGKSYTYLVTALDRLKNESEASNAVTVNLN